MIPLIKKGRILTYRLYNTAFEIDLLKIEDKLKKGTRRDSTFPLFPPQKEIEAPCSKLQGIRSLSIYYS